MTKNALISVYDKTYIEELAIFLNNNGYTIYSTGGTYKQLDKLNLKQGLIDIANYTQSPEICDGRVKTLHPKIFGGLLGKRNNEAHVKDLESINGIFFDLVVVNLYPFIQTINDPQNTEEDILEQIDIGGHSLIRACVKNYKQVSILTSPSQYTQFIECDDNNDNNYYYAQEAINHIMKYDIAINNWFNDETKIGVSYDYLKKMKYGLNPYMKPAAVYLQNDQKPPYTIINGSPGYINLLDANNAIRLVLEVQQVLGTHCCASFKHNSPAGVYANYSNDVYPLDILQKTRNIDPKSSFGDFIGFSGTIDIPFANQLKKYVSDGIIAFDYDLNALDIIKTKKSGNYVIMQQEEIVNKMEYRDVNGVTLTQPSNDEVLVLEELMNSKQVNINQDVPDYVLKDMILGFITLKYTQSNCICYVYNGHVIGIGAGQQNRVDCIEIAGKKANDWLKRNDLLDKMPLDITLVSDAFMPFADNVQKAHEYNVKYIAQPGGSMRDDEIIEECKKLNIGMIFTGKRVFTH